MVVGVKPENDILLIKTAIRISDVQHNECKMISNEESNDVSYKVNDQSRKKKSKHNKTDSKSAFVGELTSADIEELRDVYYKCKAVLKKIESKYGHLLDLENESTSDSAQKSVNKTKRNKEKVFESAQEYRCTCTLNKKFFFDESGNQVEAMPSKSDHICTRKIKSQNICEESVERENVEIELEKPELSNDLKELSKIISDPSIDITYRNRVIDKIKSVKQELASELKLQKQILIQKLKVNPNNILDFKGSNLDLLSGYCLPDE